MRALVTAFVSFLLIAASSPAGAEPIVLMEFRGTVVQGGFTDGVSLEPGDDLRARVAFDQNAVDYDPSPQNARYQFLVMDVFSNRGTVFFKQPSNFGAAEGIQIYRGATYHEFRSSGFHGLHDDTAVYARFPAGTFPDAGLPLTLPFEKATQSEFTFSIFFAPLTREALTGFTAAIVPEPQAVAMTAILLISWRRRRRW